MKNMVVVCCSFQLFDSLIPQSCPELTRVLRYVFFAHKKNSKTLLRHVVINNNVACDQASE